ncbi:DUF3748 domain-containing protein [Salmonirosea aquatica]|uniref:DUF3748 domain-containing protein n=1 Tax=Salmonirosea aquatica TaxID=2654236 RepID=A0A7C9F5D4_9BACT|nr:DUF3748 domain-containing protein [Cytophagaceae bacterium SJW1-29]
MPSETQLTHDAKGHTLNNTQAFSPDDQWLVYDTRNLDTELGQTCCVRMVNVQNGEDRLLYQTQNQTSFGPGVGAATFSPTRPEVLFLHGLRNADNLQPYAMTRRTGVFVAIEQPQKPHFLDGRDITPPFTPGALRGGTHAHQWSGDGRLISFTYNDAVMEHLAASNPAVADLRTVGVMDPAQPVTVVNGNNQDEFSGEAFAVVVARVTEVPRPGSDEIDRAFDETWIGLNGYQKPDGSHQRRALAFQGNVRNEANQSITEVFVVDLPENLTAPLPGHPLEGTPSTRPNPPAGVAQRRITFSQRGIEGPRHWLRTTPDGTLIGFLAKDPAGLIQLFGISPNGGVPRQLTHQPFSIQTPFNFSPDGHFVAYAADNSIFITDLRDGKPRRLTPPTTDDDRPINGVVWSHKGDRLAYNRYVSTTAGRYIQIFQLTMN